MEKVNPKAMNRFTEMKTAMLIHTPFFASILLEAMILRVGKYPHIQTAGTNGKVIWFDEDFLANLSLPEAVYLCCHEVGHKILDHMLRFLRYEELGFDGQPFYPVLANAAADMIINDMLNEAQVGRMPANGLVDDTIKGDWLFEDAYRELLKRFPPPPPPPPGGECEDGEGGDGGAGGDSPGKGKDPYEGAGKGKRPGNPLDAHVPEDTGMSEVELKRIIASARNQAKAMGKMPLGLDRWVDNLLQPQVNWWEHMRRFITRTVGRSGTTWTAPHRRRLIMQGVYLPSYTGHNAGTIVWITDTSGSMGQQEYDAAFAECADILKTCNPERLYLMSCDAAVHDVHEFCGTTDLFSYKPELKGGGGTDFRPAFDKVQELGIDPVLMIYFTDGYGTFPDEKPKYPVLWVSTTDATYPFGEVVKVVLGNYGN